MSYYAEYGAMGVVVALFVYGYIKQGHRADEQADALEEAEVKMDADYKVKEINDLSDVMMEVKGSVSRINGKH